MIKRKFLLDALKYVVFFGIGILIFIWVYRGQDLDQIVSGLSRFNYGWVAASFVTLLFSHLFRALRWRMLIEQIGYRPGVLNTFLAILVMYFANSAVTRLGEVTRCGILKKYEGVPFTSQLGTVLVERIVDILFLLVILAVALFLNWDVISTLLEGRDAGASGKLAILASPVFWLAAGSVVAIAVAVFLYRKHLIRIPIVQKVLSYAGKFIHGVKSVFRLRQPLLFVLLTIAIYGCYYLGTFFVMKAFAPTASLSPLVALSVLVSGSIGMVFPVPAGIGPFHYFASNTLILYGVALADSQLVTLVLHGSTTLFVILTGAIALGILPILNKSRKNGSSPETF